MSAIRAYLEQKAATPNEWLKREPRETHPEIMAAVREAVAGGVHYDDDVERFVEGIAGDLPEHHRHGHDERDALIYQLGHEVYIARKIIRDEEHQAAEDAALADGFARVDAVEFRGGVRYVVRPGVLYSGYRVPEYGSPREVRAVEDGGRIVLLPKGARTRGFLPVSPMLVREARKVG